MKRRIVLLLVVIFLMLLLLVVVAVITQVNFSDFPKWVPIFYNTSLLIAGGVFASVVKKIASENIDLKKEMFKHYFKLISSNEMVEIYELRHEINASAFRVFSFLSNKELGELCMTREQVLEFCEEFPDKIDANSSFTLLEMELDYYVADITSRKNGIFLQANAIDTSHVDKKGQRIVIPKQ